MKIENGKSKKSIFLFIFCTVFTVLLTVVFIFYQSSVSQQDLNNKADKRDGEQPITTSVSTQKTTEDDIKMQALKKNSVAEKSESISINISSINQDNNSLQIRVLIDELLSLGSCHLALSLNNNIVNRASGVQVLSSNSTCQGFDIPKSELTPGLWKLSLSVTSETRSGSITKMVEVK